MCFQGLVTLPAWQCTLFSEKGLNLWLRQSRFDQGIGVIQSFAKLKEWMENHLVIVSGFKVIHLLCYVSKKSESLRLTPN